MCKPTVGDTVLVPMIVRYVSRDSTLVSAAINTLTAPMCIDITGDQVHSVVPRPLQAGDKVRPKLVLKISHPMELLAVHDDWAWCQTCNGPSTFRLEDLVRV